MEKAWESGMGKTSLVQTLDLCCFLCRCGQVSLGLGFSMQKRKLVAHQFVG